MSDFITFNELPNQGTTKRWEIKTEEGVGIGIIRWYGGWRKYCFFPYSGSIWDTVCLSRVIDFIDQHKNDRKSNG